MLPVTFKRLGGSKHHLSGTHLDRENRVTLGIGVGDAAGYRRHIDLEGVDTIEVELCLMGQPLG